MKKEHLKTVRVRNLALLVIIITFSQKLNISDCNISMNRMTKNLKLVKSLIARVVMVMMLKNVIKKMQLKMKTIKTKMTSKNSKKPKLWTLTKIHKAALKTRLKK